MADIRTVTVTGEHAILLKGSVAKIQDGGDNHWRVLESNGQDMRSVVVWLRKGIDFDIEGTKVYVLRIVDGEEDDNVMCFGPYLEEEAQRLLGVCKKIDTHEVSVEFKLEPLFQDPVSYTREIGTKEDKD